MPSSSLIYDKCTINEIESTAWITSQTHNQIIFIYYSINPMLHKFKAEKAILPKSRKIHFFSSFDSIRKPTNKQTKSELLIEVSNSSNPTKWQVSLYGAVCAYSRQNTFISQLKEKKTKNNIFRWFALHHQNVVKMSLKSENSKIL